MVAQPNPNTLPPPDLATSLAHPHPDTAALAEAGLAAWADGLPPAPAVEVGTLVRWVPGRGWVEE